MPSVPQNIDPNKIFLVNFSELEGRLDPEQCHKERIDAINRIKGTKKYYPLSVIASFDKTITTEINTSVVYVGLENIESEYGNYIETSEKQSISSAAIFHKTDVLFPKLRPYLNKVFYASFDGICSTEFYVLKASSLVLPEYLAIFLRSSLVVNQTKHLMTGNTLPRLQTEDVKKLLVPVPPLHIQQQIVNVYNAALSQRKKKLNESKAKLASIDQYLLDELGITLPEDSHERTFIVNYKDVDGGRLDPNFYRLEYSSLVSNLRESDFCKVKDVVVFSDEMWNQESLFSDYFPYLEISGINLEYGQIEAITLTRKKDAPSRAKMILRKGDLIVSLTRPMRGAITLFDIADHNVAIGSTGFSVIRDVDSKRISKDYLCIVLKSSIVLKQFSQRCSGGNYPAITQYDLGCVSIPLPSLDKQQEIADHISAIRAEAKLLEQEGEEILQSARQQVEKMILGKTA